MDPETLAAISHCVQEHEQDHLDQFEPGPDQMFKCTGGPGSGYQKPEEIPTTSEDPWDQPEFLPSYEGAICYDSIECSEGNDTCEKWKDIKTKSACGVVKLIQYTLLIPKEDWQLPPQCD